ncbi:arsenate reductase [Prosthecochloris sp. GSB1]|uniref:arsenate reductase ArsC n=1 Tax=Prosthecochloris sp. GSB1 TaxID=281093 RepID=UPI000B8CAE22|nr:arsenate reductase ArsC [Prosthecochloris sp. GSB1]ASQ90757.1 arsenate reductase [Prosthecochloris sp. GSB1]
MERKTKVLFLCTGNSCRSQMAEGWARHLRGDIVEPYSAGVEVHGMNEHAVRVMAEAGVDISGQRSKHVEELDGIPFDCIVTVCDHARETCPFIPGNAVRIHAGFEDPPRMAAETDDPEKKLDCYRKVRDEIRDFVTDLRLNQT